MAHANSDAFLCEFRWPDDYAEVIQLWKLAGVYNPASDGPDDIQEVSKRNPHLFLLAFEPRRGIVGSVIGTFDCQCPIAFEEYNRRYRLAVPDAYDNLLVETFRASP